MNRILRLERNVVPMTRIIALIGLTGLLVQAGLTMGDVLLRWLANAPIHGLEDVSELATAIVIASCFPIVVARRQNISINFLGAALGPKVERWLEAIASLSLLLFLILVGWQLAVFTGELAESGRTTWMLQLSVTPYWIVATVVYMACVPVQAIVALTDIARAIQGGSEAADAEGSW